MISEINLQQRQSQTHWHHPTTWNAWQKPTTNKSLHSYLNTSHSWLQVCLFVVYVCDGPAMLHVRNTLGTGLSKWWLWASRATVNSLSGDDLKQRVIYVCFGLPLGKRARLFTQSTPGCGPKIHTNTKTITLSSHTHTGYVRANTSRNTQNLPQNWSVGNTHCWISVISQVIFRIENYNTTFLSTYFL